MSDRLERKVEYEANPRARREGLTCTTDLGSRIHPPTGRTLRYSQRAEEKSPASRPGYKPKSTPCRENDQDQTLPKELLWTPACKPTHIDPTRHDPSTNKRTKKSPLGPQAPPPAPREELPPTDPLDHYPGGRHEQEERQEEDYWALPTPSARPHRTPRCATTAREHEDQRQAEG